MKKLLIGLGVVVVLLLAAVFTKLRYTIQGHAAREAEVLCCCCCCCR